ncbi:MAG: hypothetical protein SFY80_14920 [Verrucomicrobiota bacterium]|nr:hypothetical protein [Verrucomicrobiota bacterium]
MYLYLESTTIRCMDEHYTSWFKANDYRGTIGAIVLKDQFGLPQFKNLIDVAKDTMNQYSKAQNMLSQAYKELASQKVDLVTIMRRVHDLVKYPVSDLHLELKLPRVPQVSSNQMKFTQQCELFRSYWELLAELNVSGLPNPLVLEGGYSLQDFTTAIAGLGAAYMNVILCKREAKSLRNRRDVLVRKQIKGRIMEYRSRINSMYDKGHEIRKEMPRVAPLPGPQPDKVIAQVRWDEALQKAVLTWTPSARPDLLRYEIRGCDEAPYHAYNERVLASVAAGQTTWQSAEGLAVEGSTMLYKVYVVTSTYRECGSKAVTLERPAAAGVTQAA